MQAREDLLLAEARFRLIKTHLRATVVGTREGCLDPGLGLRHGVGPLAFADRRLPFLEQGDHLGVAEGQRLPPVQVLESAREIILAEQRLGLAQEGLHPQLRLPVAPPRGGGGQGLPGFRAARGGGVQAELQVEPVLGAAGRRQGDPDGAAGQPGEAPLQVPTGDVARSPQGREGGGDLPGVGEALPRLFGQRLEDERPQLRGEPPPGIAVGEVDRRPEQMAGDQRGGIAPLDGVPAGEQLIEDDAEGVEVAPGVHHRGPLGPELLGRRVADLAEEDPGAGQVARLDAGVQHLGDPEVDQLDLGLAVGIGGEHQVVGGDVAMDEPLGMEIADGAQRLLGDLQGEPQGGGAAVAQDLLQRHAVDELHDDEGGAVVLVDGEIDEVRDVGVPELDGDPGLALEPGLELGVGDELRAHHLDDPHVVEEPVAYLVDSTHPTLAELLEDLVLAFDTPQRDGTHLRLLQPNFNTWDRSGYHRRGAGPTAGGPSLPAPLPLSPAGLKAAPVQPARE